MIWLITRFIYIYYIYKFYKLARSEDIIVKIRPSLSLWGKFRGFYELTHIQLIIGIRNSLKMYLFVLVHELGHHYHIKYHFGPKLFNEYTLIDKYKTEKAAELYGWQLLKIHNVPDWVLSYNYWTYYNFHSRTKFHLLNH